MSDQLVRDPKSEKQKLTAATLGFCSSGAFPFFLLYLILTILLDLWVGMSKKRSGGLFEEV
jgi:hypothetical protein